MSTDNTIRDVFGYSVSKGWMCVQVFFIRQGNMIKRDATMIPIQQTKKKSSIHLLVNFIVSINISFRKKFMYRKILIKILLNQWLIPKLFNHLVVAKMIDLANHNAEVQLENKFELIARDESRTVKAIEELGERMGIQTPIRIEAFDNSNIQGVDPVSAMVTFVDGKPDKKGYRKYKIKTVEGPDDYKSMCEVVRRRYACIK